MENCKSLVGNRFKLVVLASQRAHDLSSGATPAVERRKNKNTVLSLLEIAGRKLDVTSLFDLVVHRCKKYVDNMTVTPGKPKINSSSHADDLFSSIQNEVMAEGDIDIVDLIEIEDSEEELADEKEDEFVPDDDLFQNLSFRDDDVDVED